MSEQETLARLQRLEIEVRTLSTELETYVETYGALIKAFGALEVGADSEVQDKEEVNNSTYEIVWDRDIKDHYGTNCDCVIKEEVVAATFDTEEAAMEYLEACKTKAYRDNPSLYIGWSEERRGKNYFYRNSPLASANKTARVREVPAPARPPHNPRIDWVKK
jgi:hypothetical protein